MVATAVHVFSQSPTKLAAARSVFGAPEYDLVAVDPDVPEIQAASSMEIARYQARVAAAQLGVAVAREDHSTCFPALALMPGPYAADFEATVPIELLLELLEGRDHSGYLELALAYAQPTGETLEFIHRVPLHMSRELRGDLQGRWARSIVLDGQDRTLAEYPAEERVGYFNVNFLKLRAVLESESA